MFVFHYNYLGTRDLNLYRVRFIRPFFVLQFTSSSAVDMFTLEFRFLAYGLVRGGGTQ
jgi:hypothetical protein